MITNSPKGAPVSTPQKQQSAIEGWFEISKRGSTVSGEVRGGLVTFFTMAYILALNPLIIGTAADRDGNLISGAAKFTDAAQTMVDSAAVSQSIGMVAAVTALIAGVMTILMGVVGRFPIGLAAGLGLNAMLAYVIAPMGERGLVLAGGGPEGVYYAALTLAQLLAPVLEPDQLALPLVEVVDWPELEERGLWNFPDPAAWIPWLDESILLDVDTPEDYERLLAW